MISWRWGEFPGRHRGSPRWLHGRNRAELARVGGEGTRKLCFRQEKFREQERTLANSPGGLSRLGEVSRKARHTNHGREFPWTLRQPATSGTEHEFTRGKTQWHRDHVAWLGMGLTTTREQWNSTMAAVACLCVLRQDSKLTPGRLLAWIEGKKESWAINRGFIGAWWLHKGNKSRESRDWARSSGWASCSAKSKEEEGKGDWPVGPGWQREKESNARPRTVHWAGARGCYSGQSKKRGWRAGLVDLVSLGRGRVRGRGEPGPSAKREREGRGFAFFFLFLLIKSHFKSFFKISFWNIFEL